MVFLKRDAFNRAFLGPDGVTREGLNLLAGALRVLDPLAVELIRASGQALITVARIDQAGVAPAQQLEQ